MKKIIIFILLNTTLSMFSQTDYLMSLSNPVQISSNTLDFDIIIKSTDTNFILSSYQCALSFDLDLGQNDSISLNFHDNSSEIGNPPFNIIGYDSTDGNDKLLFVSGIGTDIITTEEKVVGRFQINSSMNFSIENLRLLWNFDGSSNTILTGSNFVDITEPSNHLNFENTVTDIDNLEVVPNQFELAQNYPNPFNPSTTINFSIPQKGNVKLIIYNMLGEKVKQVLNKEMNAGQYSVRFNGKNLASGGYIYHLDVDGKYSAVKKMMLVK